MTIYDWLSAHWHDPIVVAGVGWLVYIENKWRTALMMKWGLIPQPPDGTPKP